MSYSHGADMVEDQKSYLKVWVAVRSIYICAKTQINISDMIRENWVLSIYKYLGYTGRQIQINMKTFNPNLPVVSLPVKATLLPS